MNLTKRMTLFLATVALGACTSPRRMAPVDAHRTEWKYAGNPGTEIVTEHYQIRTTCRDPRLIQYLPEFLESCWSAYTTMVPLTGEAPSHPALSYLFQTRQQWERFTREFSPGRANTYLKIRSGGFEEHGVTVAQYDTMTSAFGVMAHEGLHQYLSVTRGDTIPPWLNEGLACYFESFQIDDDGRAVFEPRRNLFRRDHLREALMNKSLFDFKDLISTHAGRIVSLPPERVRTYYAQAWSVVLFLAELNPKRDPWGAGFRSLLADLGTPNVREKVKLDADRMSDFGEASFRAYITEDLAAFEERYHKFVRPMLGVD